MNTTLLKKYFLRAGHLEGISFLVLLGIAMPLKYVWDLPEWVSIFGMIHGVLFVIFIVLLYLLWNDKGITGKIAGLAFVLSLLPFGTFFLNKIIN